MTSRLLIAYFLIVLLAGGLGILVWRAIYNSESNVRRRARRERRARKKAREEGADDAGDPVDSDT